MSLIEKLWKRGKTFLGTRYPIMCGGMTWVSTLDLMKAVSKSGGFPVMAGGNMDPGLFEETVRRCSKELGGPFGVNLITIAPNFKKHLEIVKDSDVPIVIFAGNFPKKQHVDVVKKSGKKTMSFASTKSIARQMIGFGIDALILEGSEAGGHIGYVSLAILVQQVLFDVSEVPVFAAGGIARGGMIAHLLLMGAAGCQLGTRFAVSAESTAHGDFKKALLRARARQAMATPQYDSRLPVVAVRAIRNSGMQEFGKLQLELLRELDSKEVTREEAQYRVESFWIGSLRRAVIEGDVVHGSLMAGQSVGLVDKIQTVDEIMNELVTDAEKELQRVKDIYRSA